MKTSIYHIDNHTQVNKNFAVLLAISKKDLNNPCNDSQTLLYAAPGLGERNEGQTIIYLSTESDPILIATFGKTNNCIWSIFDEQEAKYLIDFFNIRDASDIEKLLMNHELLA
jgi:hypothetical protein